jgi:hypothetical protein
MVAPQAGEDGVLVGEITECITLPLATHETFNASIKCTYKIER